MSLPKQLHTEVAQTRQLASGSHKQRAGPAAIEQAARSPMHSPAGWALWAAPTGQGHPGSPQPCPPGPAVPPGPPPRGTAKGRVALTGGQLTGWESRGCSQVPELQAACPSTQELCRAAKILPRTKSKKDYLDKQVHQQPPFPIKDFSLNITGKRNLQLISVLMRG